MGTDIDASIFKSYDVRGIVPSQLNDEIAYAIGRAFVEVLDRSKLYQMIDQALADTRSAAPPAHKAAR